MKTVYIACGHDRHTDDEYMVFTRMETAQKWAKEWVDRSFTYGRDFREDTHFYGDWCLYCTDDYYVFVQAVELDES